MKGKISLSTIFICLLAILSVFLLGFKLVSNKTPYEMYAVYLDGKKIGTVESKESFEEFINEKEGELKEKYNVKKIYTPKGVEIKKVITYDNRYDNNEQIYQMLVKEQSFTVKGFVIEITKNENDSKTHDADIKEETETKENKITKIKINVTSKDIFDEAVVDLIKAFIDDEEYSAFMEGTQAPIVDVGEIVESIYIQEAITYRESNISTNEKIFTDKGELTKYLLYGNLNEQETYIVKDGDTIESIANANKLNPQEFLIANPEFTSVNNLLYTSQKVNVGLINPILSIAIEKHSVQEEVAKYTTEVKYDDSLFVGYSYTDREGEDGLNKVTRKYQYVNGQLVDVATINSVEIKPYVSKIVVKGSKYVPSVADISHWAWPTTTPYTITSGYAWRWGSFHDAIDISVYHGSPIYAANNGTVYEVGKGCIRGKLDCNGGRGNYVIINHNIANYYTIYMHMHTISVIPGQTVSRGQKIGTMGNTGNVYPVPEYGSDSVRGTHLHFGVFLGVPGMGGKSMNPYNIY